jgi:hypothetical protein
MGVTKAEFLSFLDDVDRGCEMTEQATGGYPRPYISGCRACFFGAAAAARGLDGFAGNMLHHRYGSYCYAGLGGVAAPELSDNGIRSRESIAEELRIAAKDGRIPFEGE